MIKGFKERRPAYFSGFDDEFYPCKIFNEVLEIDFVKNFSKRKDFYGYFASINTDPYMIMLMALYNWNEKYNGCSEWWVIGYLPEFILYETNLKNYVAYTWTHLPDCWIRKYSSCKNDLLHNDRSNRLEIAKSMGWDREDITGIANTCTCGFNDLNKK